MAFPSAIRSSAAASSLLEAQLIADTNHEPAWSGLEIDRVTIAHRLHEIASTHLMLNPFSVLMSLRLAHGEPRPKALVVMPMSGGHVLMIRDLVYGLLQTHDVAVLDWINARHVPCSAGRFGFWDNLGSAIDALRHLGAGVHLIGICQSGPVAALVASLLHQAGSHARPASLALLCSPIDPWAEQTRVASLLAGVGESWLAGSLLSPVPSTYMGHGRIVYPAELHQARLLHYLKNHLVADTVIGRKITADDGLEARRFPFLTRITRIKDIAGAAFTESISAIYHDRVLWSGGLQIGGKRIRPQTVRDLALVTVEAEGDDITAPGQTVAAHRLFARVPDRRREHLLIDDGCHFSPFHGKAAREEVVPALAAFMSAMER